MSRAAKAPTIAGLADVSEHIIYPHIFNNADREVGGILVGRVPRSEGLPMVTGAIAALGADEQRATLTFRQETWEHVHRTLDRDFPADEQIIGWYHSHPGFGIFLSEHDLFIHRNFFSGVSQIAVVVDPLAGTEGVFAWREDGIVPIVDRSTPERWPGLGVRTPRRPGGGAGTPPPSAPPSTRGRQRSAARPYPFLALALAGLVGLLFGLGMWHVVGADDGAPENAVVRQAGPAPSSSAPAKTVHRRATVPEPHPTAVEPEVGDLLPPEDENDADGAPHNPSND